MDIRSITNGLLAVVALLALGCNYGSAERRPAARYAADIGDIAVVESLDAYLESAVETLELPGLAAAVVRDGEVVYQRALGVEKVGSEEALTPTHLFHFASVSKPFVATAAMQLVETGKVDLDEKVVTYLPYFKLADPAYREITVRQMLNHTSGMTDVDDYEWDKPQIDEGAAERFVRSLSGEALIGPPGERYAYSNMAFDTMGDLIAKVSGQSFEDYVKHQILDPLGMEESTFFYPDTNEALRTSGHTWQLGPVATEHYPYNRRHAPSSTLNTNVSEMTHWIRANLARGEFEGRRILKEASYEVLWEPSAAAGSRQVGLSWFIDDASGVRLISHGGSDTGFTSLLVLIPELNTGYVIASNYERTPVRTIGNGIRAVLRGEQPDRIRRPVGDDFARLYTEEGLARAKAFYLEARDQRADEFSFSDGQINSFGYQLMSAGNIEDAIEVFGFNAEMFPDIGNCWDSLGEAQLAIGDKQSAIESYRRAVDLDPDNTNAWEILADLGTAPD